MTIESEEFYNLCQTYRHSKENSETCRAYDELIKFIDAQLSTKQEWVSVSEKLPDLDIPVWLYEESLGIWIGGRGDSGDGWLWGNCYGSHFFNTKTGKWDCYDMECDDDYQPTLWMHLPESPKP